MLTGLVLDFGAVGDAAAIGTPTGIGSNVATYSNGLTSGTMTTTAAIPAGCLALVFVHAAANSAVPITAVTDGTNTYVKAIDVAGTFQTCAIWYKENAASVASGATITVTFTGTATGAGNNYVIAASIVTGIATSSALDKTASQATSTNAPTATTAALSNANELVVGAAAQVSAGTYTQASGYTTLFALNQANQPLIVGYKIVTTTDAVTYNPTSDVTQSAPLVVATFR